MAGKQELHLFFSVAMPLHGNSEMQGLSHWIVLLGGSLSDGNIGKLLECISQRDDVLVVDRRGSLSRYK